MANNNIKLYLHQIHNVNKTISQYKEVREWAHGIFVKKTKDYGTAWRILRTSSLTDQIFIKAKRIRSIQEAGENMIDDPVDLDFIGIVNYAIMALIQLDMNGNEELDMPYAEVEKLYGESFSMAEELMKRKNHDYGEAWRDMRVSSITDLILMKILRMRQIEDNEGKTLISEGLDANYLDIVNYAIFALILLKEKE